MGGHDTSYPSFLAWRGQISASLSTRREKLPPHSNRRWGSSQTWSLQTVFCGRLPPAPPPPLPPAVSLPQANRCLIKMLLFGYKDVHVAALLNPRALRCKPPGGLGQRGGVVEVVLREGRLDGIRRLQGVIVGDG